MFQLIVRILLVPATDIARKALAFVKKDGKVLIVLKWIRMLCNVFLIVPGTVHSI